MGYNVEQGSKRKFRFKKIILIFGLIIILLLGSSVVGIRYYYNAQLKPLSASQKAVSVTIPLGSSAHDIALTLEKAGVIRAGWAFEWYIRNHNLKDKLQAGTYNIRPNQSIEEIVEVISEGKILTDLFTIIPGQRLDQIRTRFVNNGFSAEEVDQALNPKEYANESALADLPAGASLEGYLYPDSYQKITSTKASTIVRASLDEMQSYLTADVRAGFTKQGLTVHQAIILASIVEQEVSNPSDRKSVAQVFLRRIKEGIALESNATANYNPNDDKYNTYHHAGLTPTPISNVSKSSIQAVAFPSNTDYLYFVSGDDGVTHFSHTLAEHEALVKQYCTTLCN